MNTIRFSQQLLAWYQQQHRALPWRHTQNPYFIWLSEVILQQTRVNQGLPYYLRFVEHFPTVEQLAHADEREVLRLWQGLGYYSRARNMHATARLVVENHGGTFPSTYEGLLKLRGIGPYTAAAIASFAFREQVAVLDGNVFRVLARVFGIEEDIMSTSGKKVFSKLANELLPDSQTDTYNQAIMEFGAVQCTPVKPNCMFCPFSSACVAFQTGRQAVLPVKAKKAPVRTRFFNYLVLERPDGKLFMQERRAKDIWQGLYHFWLEEADALTDLDKLALPDSIRNLVAEATIAHKSEVYTHVLSHQRLQVIFWHLRLNASETDILDPKSFYDLDEIGRLPKPILINKYLNERFF